MKMPERPDPDLFAPCGVNCLVCYAHVRSKKPCPGCLCGDEGKTARCKRCAIKDCASSRGFVRCFECSGFPCASVKRLDKSYRLRYGTSLVENSRLAASIGLEAFMEFERGKWTCRRTSNTGGVCCGGAVTVHGGTCSECGLSEIGRAHV